MTVGIEVETLRELLDELTLRRLEIDALTRTLRETADRADAAESVLASYEASFEKE